ncbi:MAG: 50S ribosomal protein L11 methyltransferase [Tannerellaceae bacterium]|nr:50S ribosomal protein L11 methyltransferase [Tannerellaceae bacterium]
MNYYEIKFTWEADIEDEIVRDVLSAGLAEIGFESFVDSEDGLTAYIAGKHYDEKKLWEVLGGFPLPDIHILYDSTLIEGQDWNEEWEKNYFKPIAIDNKCMIRTSFHEPAEGYEYEIIIDPKMAFGTGNHETTWLMINEILKTDLTGKRVLDMGCGTAVLAILALKKGAATAIGIDIDEWACENATENARLNNVRNLQVVLGGAGAIAPLATEARFDIIYANINRNILLQDLHAYAAALKPGAALYMSGFYTHDIPLLRTEAERLGLQLVGKAERNDWALLEMRKATT